MMGRQTVDQSQLFYLFNLEKRIPARHLLRRINPTVTRISGAPCQVCTEPSGRMSDKQPSNSGAASCRPPRS
jgi:hypothetical protein